MRKFLHAPVCRLTLANLKSLIKILEQGMGDKKSLSLSYELKGTEMPFSSLDELLEHADTPSILYSLYLSASANNWESNKRAAVVFYNDGPPYITVEGKDEAWVIGKCKQIENFLINKKAKFAFLHEGKIFWCISIPLLIVTVYNLTSLLGVNLISSNLTFYSLRVDKLISFFGLLSWVLYMYLVLLKSKPKILYPYTVIKLKEGWDINTKLSLGMLILGVLSILVPIVIFILSTRGSKS